MDDVGGGRADPAGLLAAARRARPARPRVPRRVRRRRRRLPLERGARRGDGALPVGRRGLQRARAHRHVLALAHALRHRGAEAALPAGHRRGRDGVRARHHRAGHGLGHGRGGDARGAARRSLPPDRAARSSSPTGSTAISTSSPRAPGRARPSGATTASRCSSSSAGWPGFTREPQARQDGDARLGHRRARASRTARCPRDNLLGVEGRGFQQLAAGLQRERIMAAVLALSGAAQALEDTVGVSARAPGLRRAASPTSRRSATGSPTWRTEIEAARQLVYRAAALYAGRRGLRHRRVHGQALRHRGGQPRGVPGGAAARRLRLHARVPRRALLPRRAALDRSPRARRR